MIEITPKEIENVGANRYLSENRHKRLWWAIIPLIIAFAFVITFSVLTEHRLNVFIRGAIEIPIIIGAFYYYWRVLIIDAPKAGKKFRKEYEKEQEISGKV